MANPDIIKNYIAEGAVGQFLIVKAGSVDGKVAVAAAVGDKLLGVSTFLNAADTEPCDVIHDGIADVIAGAAILFGAAVTSDSAGRAVTAAPSAGVNDRIVGIALHSAAALGDVIPVLITLGVVQG